LVSPQNNGGTASSNSLTSPLPTKTVKGDEDAANLDKNVKIDSEQLPLEEVYLILANYISYQK
jgi:hypothetical protein